MTAEIAVLNRHAVALAADSAVTLKLPEGPKIYQTNKLFTLSKYQPVGVMIYGAAEFMGVPWETIVKQYRSQLGRRAFPRLEVYATDFLRFLEKHSSFFPRKHQRSYCEGLARWWLRRLKSRLKKAVEEKYNAGASLSEDDVRKMIREIAREDVERLRMHKNLRSFSKTGPMSLFHRCRTDIQRAIADELKPHLNGAVPTRELQLGCALAIVRDFYWHGESGVVIAGFGDDEFLPGLRCMTLDAIIDGKLRAKENTERRVQITTTDVSASVTAFAQSEMVALFMNGIDSDYHRFVRSFVSELMSKGYPSVLEKVLRGSLSSGKTSKMIKSLRIIGERLSESLGSALQRYSRQMHSDPIVDIVNYLPKEELAAMAEALVNLTSFKRHVRGTAETVGGPIDVAVISRGDGFVWIKRKHYFNPNLNPHFVTNYFRNDGSN